VALTTRDNLNVRRSAPNVKHCQSGYMALRSTAGRMLEAERQFRRVMGHGDDLAKLASTVERGPTRVVVADTPAPHLCSVQRA